VGDLGIRVPSLFQFADLPEHFDACLPASDQVLREAHQQKLLTRGGDDERWHGGIAQLAAGLQPALPADQFIERLALLGTALNDVDRLLKPDIGDVRDDLLKLDLPTLTRIHHRDLVDRNADNIGVAMVDHAATSIWMTLAIPRKNSRDSNLNVSIKAPLNCDKRNLGSSMSMLGNRY